MPTLAGVHAVRSQKFHFQATQMNSMGGWEWRHGPPGAGGVCSALASGFAFASTFTDGFFRRTEPGKRGKLVSKHSPQYTPRGSVGMSIRPVITLNYCV
jgi:hypothetical protein